MAAQQHDPFESFRDLGPHEIEGIFDTPQSFKAWYRSLPTDWQEFYTPAVAAIFDEAGHLPASKRHLLADWR